MRKRRHSSRSSYRRKNGSPIKMLAIIALPVVVITLAVFIMQHVMGIEKSDEDYCYDRGLSQHKTAIFIDNSLAHLTDVHMRDYHAAFERAYEASPVNSQLLFYTTAKDKNGSLVKPFFRMCKPAVTPAEQASIHAPEKPAPYLTRQAEEAYARYQQAVTDTLREVQDKSQRAGDSPILEQIRAISRAPEFQGETRSLTIITDGLNNSQTARFCVEKGHMPSFTTFAKRADYNLAIKPRSFASTDVSLLLVEAYALPSSTMPYCSNHELRTWWVNYLEANHANVELTLLRYWAGQ